ncbi:type IV pilus modification PilV family protein [Pseudomonas gingeri]
MTASSKSTQSGFTLLEVLAAVALLSVGFAIFLNTMGYTTRALARDKQTTELALIAKSIFDERTKELIKPGQWEGKTNEVNWKLTSTLMPSKPPVELYRLELELEQGAQHVHLSTLRAQGTASGQAR